MRITTQAEYIWSDKQQKHLLVKRQSINWTGLIAFAKGASSGQTAIAGDQQKFYQSLTADYAQQFANQSNILSTLNKSLSPILAGGINQFGFSQGETNALNSSAIQNTGQQYANASKALRENQAAQGGGNSLLPSGVAQQQQAALGAASANEGSNQLLGIQQAGYSQGRQNYNNAVGQLGGVAGMYNPTAFSGQATGAGTAAFNERTAVDNANNAANPWGMVGGILGGAAGSLIGMPGLGASLGAGIAGGATNSGGGPYIP